MAQLKQIMRNNTRVLEQVVQQTTRFRTTRPSRAPQSIFDMSFTTQSLHHGDESSIISSTRFLFDDEVINSQVYRRAFTRVSARNKGGHQAQGFFSGHEPGLAVDRGFASAYDAIGSGKHRTPRQNTLKFYS